MLKKILLISALFMAIPCLAETDMEGINMTPQKTFSGYTNSGVNYPKLNNVHNSNIYRNYSTHSQQRAEIMKAKSVKDISRYSYQKDDPMTFNKFPQNRDSSDMMHLQQINNGVQNMFMNF